MGYYIRPGLVTQNREELELIYQVVMERGKELRFNADRSSLHQAQYHLRRVLKAAEVLPEEGRKYKNLCASVVITVDSEASQLVVKLKGKGADIRRRMDVQDENGALRAITTSSPLSEVQTTTFKPSPSYNEGEFTSVLSSEGWEVVMLDPIGDGVLLVTAEREVTNDAMESLGFGRRDVQSLNEIE